MELRDYQIELSDQATAILNEFKLVYLALEVRTGKTITALETCRKFGAVRVLFITKKKAIGSIEADAVHYPGLTVDVINYESVTKMTGKYDIVICDEAHGLGAFPEPSKRAKEVKEICKGLPVIFLSGTPSPESYSQLFHSLYVSSFSIWLQYRNFYKWAAVYVDKKIKYLYSREINDYSHAKNDLIERDMKPIILTYTQKEAGFEVVVDEKILNVQMPYVIKMIQKLLKDSIIEGKNTAIIADTAVKMQSKIQQMCGGTIICEDGNGYILDRSKAEFVRDYFKGQKIAIYYKFQAELDLLKQTMVNYTTSSEEFQKSPNLTFLGQFQSAREGIRLDTADAIVFYSIDFSYLSYEQGKNRMISKERTKDAVLYWIFCDGGIEQKIYDCVSNKKSYTTSYFKKDYQYSLN